MSALEKFSVLPDPARHAVRALPAAQASGGSRNSETIDALIRLAERLLPSVLFILDRGDPALGLLTWPPGVMGRRVPIEPVARQVLVNCDCEGELWVPDLAAEPAFAALDVVAAAGPLALARLPLREGGALAAMRAHGDWTSDERDTLRDLAVALGAAVERERIAAVAEAAVAEAQESAARVQELTRERARDAQARVAERVRAVGPLLTGVCHELNNPLTSIRSFAELLLLDAHTEEDREALEIVQREAHRASRIVADLRMVASRGIEVGDRSDLVDVNEVVSTVVRGRSQELAVERIECLLDLAPSLPLVRVARRQLEQVISHLVSNAVQAVVGQPGARCITLSTHGSGVRVSLIVGDSGRGMTPEQLERVFDPFWTGRAPGEGSGLGLSLVQSVVADHGGVITAASRPGKGSLFTVELPGADELPADVSGVDEPEAREGLRVLVVDDEAPIRFSLVRYLERRGHRVDQAEHGNEALRMVAESALHGGAYDMVIADLRMPGIDGDQLHQCLRERGDALEDRLILMTGEAHAPLEVQALQEAGVPVIWKPFELAEVAQIIEAHARLLA